MCVSLETSTAGRSIGGRVILTPQGTALDELIEGNNFSQLIDQPTNIETTGKF